MKNNIVFCCRLQIFATIDLEALADLLSRRVFGGVPFVGRSENIRDEFPAVYTSQAILGTRFVLSEDVSGGWFYLECQGTGVNVNMTPEEIRRSFVDISTLIGVLIENENGITVNVLKPANGIV